MSHRLSIILPPPLVAITMSHDLILSDQLPNDLIPHKHRLSPRFYEARKQIVNFITEVLIDLLCAIRLIINIYSQRVNRWFCQQGPSGRDSELNLKLLCHILRRPLCLLNIGSSRRRPKSVGSTTSSSLRSVTSSASNTHQYRSLSTASLLSCFEPRLSDPETHTWLCLPVGNPWHGARGELCYELHGSRHWKHGGA